MNIPENLPQTTDEALLSICLFAAFCDGVQRAYNTFEKGGLK